MIFLDKNFYKELEALLTSVISQHFIRNLPKFRGTVEIDESCFKSSATKKCKRSPEK